MPPISCRLEAKYSNRGFLSTGASTKGRLIIICHNLQKAFCCLSLHMKFFLLFSNLEKADVIDPRPSMNLQI